MTAAPGPSPQQIRDRLLEAIDRHSNIHNMVAVLEVISSLEKYPITKEALEETRLGKLINDVRKKTKNEDLAKRAKKLLRNWQKLIEPVTPGEGALRGLPSAPGSANGGAHHCRLEAPPAAAAGPKPVQDVKSRNDIQKIHSPKPGNRKRKGGEPRESVLPPPPKAPKVSYEGLPNSSSSSSTPPTNGIGGSPESFPSPPDGSFSSGPEPGESDKPSKIPINAVRPHTSSPGLFKASSGPPSLLKAAASVLPEKVEESAAGQPRSPRCSSFSPRPGGLEGFARQHAPYAAKGRAPARSPRPPLPEAPGARPLLSPLPASSTLPGSKRSEGPQPPEGPPRGSESPAAAPEGQLRLGPAAAAPAGTPPAEPSSVPGAGISPGLDSDGGAASGSEGKKKKKKHLHQHHHQHHRPQDYVLHLDGQAPEGAGVKPVRLKKERRLTFDPMTGEIKPLAQRDALAAADLPALAEPPRTGPGPLGEAKAPLHSPFEQTNWKELSRNEIIQSYLTRQSSLLSSSGAQTPGAHYFMSEYLKQEESTRREARKTHVLAPHAKPSELPGVTREVTGEDLGRLGGRPWPGVNGCYDTQGNWYDWTQGISLDPHGDSGHLNILPYVCLD